MPIAWSTAGRKLCRPPLAALTWVLLVATWCDGKGRSRDGSDAASIDTGTGGSELDAQVASDGVALLVDAGAAVADAGPPPPDAPVVAVTSAVLTSRNDNFRTGAQLAERQLDVATVRARGMTLLFGDRVDGETASQPLYVPGLEVNGKARDVVFVTTLANSVYAFDANEAVPGVSPPASTKLWQVTLADPENPAARPLARGIYSTPVIDLASNTLYLVHSTRNTRRDNGKLTPDETALLDVELFLVAVDLRTGAQRRVRKIQGTYPRSDGSPVAFEARNHWCRPALLFGHGSLYVSCGMRNDENTTIFHGWVFRYDAATLEPQGTFCTTPDVTIPADGASVWQSGSGPAEDADGNVYVITGNGPADFAHHSYGDALLKLSPRAGGLAFAGAFTSEGPDGRLQRHDVDFGSGGPLVLPDAPYVFGAGKTGIGYLLERDGLTKRQQFGAAVNQYDPLAPVDVFWSGGPHLHGTATYWRSPHPNTAYVYSWGEQDYLRRHLLDLTSGLFDPEKVLTGKVLGLPDTMPGGTLSLSADGTRPGSAIVWATLRGPKDGDPRAAARLIAHDAETLDVIWETTYPSEARWMPPTIADGKVFVATGAGKLLIYGLGPAAP
jgi:outer membrane protein assembly factor BamB